VTYLDEETYDDRLGYDADHNDDSQYCIHGTFIGSWWGPDYMCGWCEEGASVAEVRAFYRRQRDQKVLDVLKIRTIANEHFHTPRHLTWYVNYVLDQIERNGITAEEIERLEQP
jgi:hypothetical protein